MISAYEIRNKLAMVAVGKLSLNSFEDWFVSYSWDVHTDSPPDAVDLAESMHLLFSERNDGLLNENELSIELAALAGPTYQAKVVSSGVAAPQNRYVHVEITDGDATGFPVFHPSPVLARARTYRASW